MTHMPKESFYVIGQIIAVHPEVTNLPLSNEWVSCDGVEDLGSNFNTPTTKVPNLTDSRFLVGISGSTASSLGSNIMADHTHTVGNQTASHSHSFDVVSTYSAGVSAYHCHLMLTDAGASSISLTSTSYVAKAETPNVGDTDYTFRFTTSTANTIRSKCGSADHSHSTNPDAKTSCVQRNSHSHSAGTGGIPTSISLLPQYFTVKYYIKVK